MNNEWLNDLRKKMEDHTEDIPDGLWEDIREELFSADKSENNIGIIPEADSQEKKNSETKITLVFYRIGGIAAAIALLFIVGKKLFDQAADQTVIQKTYTVKKKTMPVDNDSTVFISEEKNNTSSEKENQTVSASSGKTSSKGLLENINERKNGIIQMIQPETQETGVLKSILDKNNEIVQDHDIIINDNSSEELNNFSPKDEKEKNDLKPSEKTKLAKHPAKKSWTLGMLTGNTSLGSAEQFPGYASLNGSTMSIDDQVWSTGYEDNPLTEILLANQNKEVEARVRHKVPVTLGVSLYRNIGKRWGVGAGINYTKLSTELRTGSNSNFIQSDQTVHYVGIPVQVNYNVIQKGAFTGYITGGALVEKAVDGNLKTKYIVNNEIKEENQEKINVKPVQFSVNSAIGLQLKVVGNLGIYAEPGIGYHFKDNSSLNTIYKDKPLNFNMRFGIRVSID